MKKLVNYTFSLKTIILSFFLVASMSAQGALITLSASNNRVNVGDSIDVYFDVSELSSDVGDSLSGFEFDAFFDSNILSYKSFSFSSPLNGNQLDFDTIDPLSFGYFGEISNSIAGQLNVFAISGNSDEVLDTNQVDEFRFLRLSFTALRSAVDTELAIDASTSTFIFGQNSLTNTSFDTSSILLTVEAATGQPPEAVPTPSIIWMFISSIAIMLTFRNSKIKRGL